MDSALALVPRKGRGKSQAAGDVGRFSRATEERKVLFDCDGRQEVDV